MSRIIGCYRHTQAAKVFRIHTDTGKVVTTFRARE